jgi:TRAP-type C4-dicarboxylate transport system permease small subunit
VAAHRSIERALDVLARLEAAVLVLAFALLVAVAGYQIAARNLWGGGLAWGDAFVRVAVLWVAVVGVLAASRNDSHIRIDLVSRFLSPAARAVAGRASALFTAAVSGTFAWHAAQFVLLEREAGIIAFASVPAWVCEAVLPVGFALISLKYLLRVAVVTR